MTQFAEPFTLCKMSNGHFNVQPTAKELTRYKNYIYQSKKYNIEKMRINNSETEILISPN